MDQVGNLWVCTVAGSPGTWSTPTEMATNVANNGKIVGLLPTNVAAYGVALQGFAHTGDTYPQWGIEAGYLINPGLWTGPGGSSTFDSHVARSGVGVWSIGNAITLGVQAPTVTSGAVTVGPGYNVANVTGLSATTAITLSTSGAVDGQELTVRVTDNGTGRTISWVNTENSTVSVPTSTTASTMKTVKFQYNSVTSNWRCCWSPRDIPYLASDQP